MKKSRRREFSVIVHRDEEGFYVASVPELHGCHTQARSLDKLMERIREAVELCLEVGGDSRAEGGASACSASRSEYGAMASIARTGGDCGVSARRLLSGPHPS